MVTKDYLLPFNLEPCELLDRFALLARQDYNLGGNGEWFGCFRGGIYGLYARIYGVRVHFHEVHAWHPETKGLADTEYHLSSIFFNMDSAMECFVYAINALGFAASSTAFLDVTNDRALRQVAPWNILGRDTNPPLAGYNLYFPNLQAHWQENQSLLDTITEQHDVSKHRSSIFVGGQARNDPPAGFYEKLGIGDDRTARALLRPMAEILLRPEPKTPPGQRQVATRADFETLEAVGEAFCAFINTSGVEALEDAKSHIALPHSEFLR